MMAATSGVHIQGLNGQLMPSHPFPSDSTDDAAMRADYLERCKRQSVEIFTWNGYFCIQCDKPVSAKTTHFGKDKKHPAQYEPYSVHLVNNFVSVRGHQGHRERRRRQEATVAEMMQAAGAGAGPAAAAAQAPGARVARRFNLPEDCTEETIELFASNIVRYFSRAQPSREGTLLPHIPGTGNQVVSLEDLCRASRLVMERLTTDVGLRHRLDVRRFHNMLAQPRTDALYKVILSYAGCPTSAVVYDIIWCVSRPCTAICRHKLQGLAALTSGSHSPLLSLPVFL